jgi:hypothetical protein
MTAVLTNRQHDLQQKVKDKVKAPIGNELFQKMKAKIR